MGIFEQLLHDGADPGIVEEIRNQIEAWILPGFCKQAEVVEDLDSYLNAEGLNVDGLAELLVGELWQARLVEQQTWAERTDADNLAAAFAELDAAGVIARMNFACCQSCGTTEILDERPADRPASGYVFFHQQDTDRVIEDAVLFLTYGPLDPSPDRIADQTAEVGHQVVNALRAHSLPVTWTGSANQRIQVGPLTWLRRLPV